MFLWWINIDPSVFSSSSYEEVLVLYISRRHLSSKYLILLLLIGLRIYINGKYLNCFAKEEFNISFFYASPKLAGIYLFKVNNRNTRTRCEICSKLTINTPERRHWRRSGVFIVNFEHISHLVLVFLLLTLSR